MAKSIQERVRAQIAKREAAEKRAEQVKANRSMGAARAADTRRENRLTGLLNGSVAPRNLRELMIADDFTDYLEE